MKRIPLPLIAAVIAGVALWLSRASFDVAGTTSVPVRVAMLPSLPELAGLITLTLIVGLARISSRPQAARGEQRRDRCRACRDAPRHDETLARYLPRSRANNRWNNT